MCKVGASMVSQWERIRPLMRGMQEMQVRPLGEGDPLKAEMVTHSSILAWKTPWAGEPGGLHGITESDTTQHTRAAQLCLDFLWGYLPRVFTVPAGGGVQKSPVSVANFRDTLLLPSTQHLSFVPASDHYDCLLICHFLLLSLNAQPQGSFCQQRVLKNPLLKVGSSPAQHEV